VATTSEQLFEFVKAVTDQKLDGTGEPTGFPSLAGEHLAAAISTVARLAAHEMDIEVAERHADCTKDRAADQAFGNYN
jgi:hypothetical protein